MEQIKDFFKKHWLLILILIVATFLRFYKLGSIPPGLHPDEAANGLDIISMFDSHKFAAIYDTNGPREALFFYLQAIPLLFGKYLGVAALNFTPLALRVAPAVVGVLTVFTTYLLGKEFYNKNVGLFAAAAMSASAWHIQFSRNGFRAIMAPLALTLVFYFLIRAYRNSKVWDYVWLGAALAMGFYTYLSFRMVPLVFGALFIYLLVKDRQFIVKNFKKLLATGGVMLLLMVPLFIHFYHVPADIAGRSSTSIFNPELNGGSPVKTLGSNIVKTTLMFNVHGDENFRHNLGGTPMIDPVSGTLFWIGVIILLATLFSIESFILVMWTGALSLPELLTAEGIPHALRIVGIMPVIFIAIGLALDKINSKFKLQEYSKYIVVMFLAVITAFGYYKYFVQFPSYGETGEAYAEDMVAIGRDVNNAPKDRSNILIVGEYGTKTVQFVAYPSQNSWERYEVRDITQKLRKPATDNFKLFVSKEWYQEARLRLPQVGFNGQLRAVNSPIDGRVIYYEYEQN